MTSSVPCPWPPRPPLPHGTRPAFLHPASLHPTIHFHSHSLLPPSYSLPSSLPSSIFRLRPVTYLHHLLHSTPRHHRIGRPSTTAIHSRCTASHAHILAIQSILSPPAAVAATPCVESRSQKSADLHTTPPNSTTNQSHIPQHAACTLSTAPSSPSTRPQPSFAPATMSPSAAQAAPAPQPISAQPNPSRPARKMSTSQHPLRLPSYSRGGASPMSFGAAMSGVSFTNGGGFSYGKGTGDVPGSYGAKFYGEGR